MKSRKQFPVVNKASIATTYSGRRHLTIFIKTESSLVKLTNHSIYIYKKKNRERLSTMAIAGNTSFACINYIYFHFTLVFFSEKIFFCVRVSCCCQPMCTLSTSLGGAPVWHVLCVPCCKRHMIGGINHSYFSQILSCNEK